MNEKYMISFTLYIRLIFILIFRVIQNEFQEHLVITFFLIFILHISQFIGTEVEQRNCKIDNKVFMANKFADVSN